MAGEIKATPRNGAFGTIADAIRSVDHFAGKPFGYDNPPGRIISNLLGLPAIANTADEMSYGGALGTGKGMTWGPKADTVDAAMTLAPLVAAAPAVINRGAAAVGKAMEPGVARLVNQIMSKGGRGSELLTDMASGTKSPATVWHGSPHKFDKFDASKIGTGEGAQAYGHGLYFAESPEVAGQYAANVKDMGAIRDVNAELSRLSKVMDSDLKFGQYRKFKSSAGEEAAKQYDALMAQRSGISNAPGQMYKIDLPDEHIAKMLDWDKPLSQQHPDVQKMLEPLGYSSKAQVAQYEDDLMASLFGDASAPLQKIRDPMGSDIARGGGVFDGRVQVEKAKRLQELGIPGIRYLDGGSRGAGAGTSNFVVFPGNEDILTILERNGMPAASPIEKEAIEKFVYPQRAAPDGSVSDVFAATAPKNIENVSPKFYEGVTYYEPPAERAKKINDLFGTFGNFEQSVHKFMSPKTARALHEKGMLNASKSELELLLDMTDKYGNIRPQVSPPMEYADGGHVTVCKTGIDHPKYADGGSVRAMVNAAVGSSNLAKQVGNSADAVRSIAAGTGSMGDLNSLRQMAASMGYTSPGLSQAMGLAGAAKAGYNAMTDPSARNLAGFASSVNPLAAKALSIYNAVTNPEPAGFVDALASFNPLTSAWNTLARAADFATLGQVVRNVNKISDPNAPAELRDMLSNNPNSASLTRNANDLSALTGRDSLDTMMDMTGAFGTIPGVPSYYSGGYGSGGGGTTSAPNGGGSFPSYSGGDGVNGHSDAGGYGGYGGGF